MSQFIKQYRDFFIDSDAGRELMTSLNALVQSEYITASRSEDMEANFAHVQRAKGAQSAIDKIMTLMTEVKKPH